jgi:hypothetical protein
LLDLGAAVADYQDCTFVNLKSKRIQCDEIWSFVGAKKKTVQKDPSILTRNPDAGDLWTWTALDSDSKLMISWFLWSGRDRQTAYALMQDIRKRVDRVQLTTDQLSVYMKTVDQAFGIDVDYAQLHKIYAGGGNGRYSPAESIGCRKVHRHWRSGPIAHQHVARRAFKSDDAHVDASIHRPDECVLAEGRESCGDSVAVFHVVQLRPGPSDTTGDASNGS